MPIYWYDGELDWVKLGLKLVWLEQRSDRNCSASLVDRVYLHTILSAVGSLVEG
jgi:hypothetical protein